ncbi:acyltransferase family protein [Tatumella citrea]|uniref:Acyltransferase 3 domain-containing protein n=1 Tax=Tatumella citrea TaxID=53336 RepID=A0A1Y0LKG5_TATCI|nr:acyltransferase family protein [Tatumella citrea]ARU94546.1 hypothetical protein A7K98_12705 [Tatumella citrea]ARU98584.1 hypothetical protein A7K99_12695 [Tatumella citrea]
MSSEIKKRVEWIDISKGIAIILVVAGHILTGNLKYLIFTFHMPFFFILSGYLQNPNGRLKLKKHTKLISQYILYWIAFTCFDALVSYARGGLTLSQIETYAFNFSMGGAWLTGSLGVFWFIPVFILSSIVLNLASKMSTVNIITTIVIMLSLSYVESYYVKTDIIYDLDVCLYSIPLMLTGHLVKRNESLFTWRLVFPCFIISCIAMVLLPGFLKIDLKATEYGFPVISLFVALSVTLFIMKTSKSISNKIVLLFGESSLTVMFIHQFIHFNIAQRINRNTYSELAITLSLCFIYITLKPMILKKRTTAIAPPYN